MATIDTRRVDPHAAVRDCAVALRVAGWEPAQFPNTTVWTAPNAVRRVILSGTATTARIVGPGFELVLSFDADPGLFELVLTAAIGALT